MFAVWGNNVHINPTRVILLFTWILISFRIRAEAGDSAVFGRLSPHGPSFTAGGYEGFGFLYDRIEQDMLILWGAGLISFFMKSVFLLLYIAAMVTVQLLFISQVNDRLLWVTGLAILIPVELIFMVASYFWVKFSDTPKAQA